MISKVQGQVPTQDASPARANDAARLKAAQQFEGLLVRQLLSAMRRTAQSGGLGSSEGASSQYLSMFDEAIADKLAEGPGIGLAPLFVQAMGGEVDPAQLPAMQPLSAVQTLRTAPSLEPPAHLELPTGLRGATERLARAAYAMASPEQGKQWGYEGTLTRRDLSSTSEVETARGAQSFSVEQAGGYRDAYKCNLFALEAARRAGYQVPVVNRASGVGFPTTNLITNDVADGQVQGDWAVPVAASDTQLVIDRVNRGEAAVLLTGSGADGRHGHMAVIERIHDVKYAADGSLEHIEFDGWEARKDGAQHLQRRSWNRYGHGEDKELARNGFERIHLLALRPTQEGESSEIPVSFRALTGAEEKR